MPFNLLAASDDTTVTSSAVLFGADATNSASPSKFTIGALFEYGAQAGTITANKPFTISQTWNNAAVTFNGLLVDITNTASLSDSSPVNVRVGGASVFSVQRNGVVRMAFIAMNEGSNGSVSANYIGYGFECSSGRGVSWSNAINTSGGVDTTLRRDAAGIVSVRGEGTTSPGAFSLYTYGASPPAAPSASMARLYADTSGGKIRLMAVFPSGAAQQIAIEP